MGWYDFHLPREVARSLHTDPSSKTLSWVQTFCHKSGGCQAINTFPKGQNMFLYLLEGVMQPKATSKVLFIKDHHQHLPTYLPVGKPHLCSPRLVRE